MFNDTNVAVVRFDSDTSGVSDGGDGSASSSGVLVVGLDVFAHSSNMRPANATANTSICRYCGNRALELSPHQINSLYSKQQILS